MLAIERRNRILEKLQKDKRVVVSELSRLYQVSEETIRRDLEKLENDGLVIKSYGGAVLNEHSIFDLPFNIRKNQMIAEKTEDRVYDCRYGPRWRSNYAGCEFYSCVCGKRAKREKMKGLRSLRIQWK